MQATGLQLFSVIPSAPCDVLCFIEIHNCSDGDRNKRIKITYIALRIISAEQLHEPSCQHLKPEQGLSQKCCNVEGVKYLVTLMQTSLSFSGSLQICFLLFRRHLL